MWTNKCLAMGSKTKILRIDDQDIELVLFKLLLRNHYEVITASSGNKGLEILSEIPDIKIIFTDYQMPGMDGLCFIQQAKSQFPDKAFFLVSSLPETKDEIWQAIRNKQVSGFIQKPLKQEILIATIEDALNLNVN